MAGPSRRGAWVLSGSVQVAAAAVSSAASADRIIEDEVRELVRRRGLDPLQEPDAIRRLVDEVINDYEERSLLGALPALGDRADAARAVPRVSLTRSQLTLGSLKLLAEGTTSLRFRAVKACVVEGELDL